MMSPLKWWVLKSAAQLSEDFSGVFAIRPFEFTTVWVKKIPPEGTWQIFYAPIVRSYPR